MRLPTRLLLALAAATLASSSAVAQSAQRFSVQGSFLFNNISGNAFEGLKNGKGFEAQARYTPGALSYGVGFQYTKHDLQDVDFALALYGAFFEPRYVIAISSNFVAPYLSARFSVLRLHGSNSLLDAKATGFNANAGGGLLFRVSSHVNMDAGATFGYTKFGDFTIHPKNGQPDIKGQTGNGTNLVLRLGVAIGLGG